MEKLLARIAQMFTGSLVTSLHFDEETETYTVLIDGHLYEAEIGSDDDDTLFFFCEALNSSFDVEYLDCFEEE